MSAGKPLVSFIIPCYNQGHYIFETVKSAYSQPYRPIEVIVVNDGSSQPETGVALNRIKETWPEVIVLEIENSGPSVARNLAVKQCKGKYIVPLDGDDLIESNTLEQSIRLLEVNDKIAVVYGDNETFGEIAAYKKQQPFSVNAILLHNSIAFCSVIRTKAYMAVGGLDEWLSKRGLEDWEFWIRLHRAGWLFCYVPALFFKIRTLNSSRTVNVANKNLDEIQRYVWQKHLDFAREQYAYLYHEHKNFQNRMEVRARKKIVKILNFLGFKR